MRLWPRKRVFLDHEGLSQVRQLRKRGQLKAAEERLLSAIPSPAVLDQLRMMASTRAREAKKAGDWATVARHLEEYDRLADRDRAYCIRTVNQEPPPHTKTDQRLLKQARDRMTSE